MAGDDHRGPDCFLWFKTRVVERSSNCKLLQTLFTTSKLVEGGGGVKRCFQSRDSRYRVLPSLVGFIRCSLRCALKNDLRATFIFIFSPTHHYKSLNRLLTWSHPASPACWTRPRTPPVARCVAEPPPPPDTASGWSAYRIKIAFLNTTVTRMSRFLTVPGSAVRSGRHCDGVRRFSKQIGIFLNSCHTNFRLGEKKLRRNNDEPVLGLVIRRVY